MELFLADASCLRWHIIRYKDEIWSYLLAYWRPFVVKRGTQLNWSASCCAGTSGNMSASLNVVLKIINCARFFRVAFHESDFNWTFSPVVERKKTRWSFQRSFVTDVHLSRCQRHTSWKSSFNLQCFHRGYRHFIQPLMLTSWSQSTVTRLHRVVRGRQFESDYQA